MAHNHIHVAYCWPNVKVFIFKSGFKNQEMINMNMLWPWYKHSTFELATNENGFFDTLSYLFISQFAQKLLMQITYNQSVLLLCTFLFHITCDVNFKALEAPSSRLILFGDVIQLTEMNDLPFILYKQKWQ